MKLSVGIALGHALFYAFSEKQWLKSLFILSLCCLVYFQWPVIHLWGFWAFVVILIYGKNNREALTLANCFLILWLAQETLLGSWTAVPWIGIIFFLFSYFVIRWLNNKWLGPKLLYFLLLFCVAITTYDIFKIQLRNPDIQIAQDKTIMPSYSPGPLLAKILKGKLVEPGLVAGDIGISSLIFDKGPYLGSQHILLAEHDIEPLDPEKVLRSANAKQIEPWSHNQLFGNQYLLEAIAQDGLWMANLGGSLKPVGKLLLGSLSHFSDQTITPLVLKSGKFTYVQDSDSFVDRIANRQENIVKEIVLGRPTPRLFNLLFCILILFSSSLGGLVLRFAGIVVISVVGLLPKEGDIRVKAKLDWSHEPSKASGVTSSLVDKGYLVRLGNKNTQILIVGQGKTSTITHNEKLVILEPGATAIIGKHTIQAGTDPLGYEHGIIDARKLLIDNEENPPAYLLEDIQIIGTGSPSKIDWGKWLG